MRRTPATIVVLEGNAAVQELIDKALRLTADRVLITNNPGEALELARRVRIDLIIGDTALLAGTDPRVVQQLELVAPVLFTHVEDGSPLAGQDGGNALRSPFTLEELTEAIAAALLERR